MKKNIHPERKIVTVTLNDGTTYQAKIALANGSDKFIPEVDSTTHPAWKQDGNIHIINKSGQAANFSKKYGGIA